MLSNLQYFSLQWHLLGNMNSQILLIVIVIPGHMLMDSDWFRELCDITLCSQSPSHPKSVRRPQRDVSSETTKPV